MRKTKIVCTLGPATDSYDMIKKLIKAGMNVARVNMSHGDHEEHKRRIDLVKRAREELNIPVAILMDTKGPEIRVRTFENGKAVLETLSAEEINGVVAAYEAWSREADPGFDSAGEEIQALKKD